jgi:hypothetical protein
MHADFFFRNVCPCSYKNRQGDVTKGLKEILIIVAEWICTKTFSSNRCIIKYYKLLKFRGRLLRIVRKYLLWISLKSQTWALRDTWDLWSFCLLCGSQVIPFTAENSKTWLARFNLQINHRPQVLYSSYSNLVLRSTW